MSPRSTAVLVLIALFVALATASDAPDTGVDSGNRRMLKLKIEGETKYWAGGADVSANPKAVLTTVEQHTIAISPLSHKLCAAGNSTGHERPLTAGAICQEDNTFGALSVRVGNSRHWRTRPTDPMPPHHAADLPCPPPLPLLPLLPTCSLVLGSWLRNPPYCSMRQITLLTYPLCRPCLFCHCCQHAAHCHRQVWQRQAKEEG
jgi:hypothetical protein